MGTQQVQINRAPVLTLWAAVVAERLGYDREEALTLGRAVAGLNAQAKGQRLGIFKPPEKTPEQARAQKKGEEFRVELLGRAVPAMHTEEGIRAAEKGKPARPASVERYLESKFGEALPEVRRAMETLAQACDLDTLANRAYGFYEEFRPAVPAGMRGWGARGTLDLARITALTERCRAE